MEHLQQARQHLSDEIYRAGEVLSRSGSYGSGIHQYGRVVMSNAGHYADQFELVGERVSPGGHPYLVVKRVVDHLKTAYAIFFYGAPYLVTYGDIVGGIADVDEASWNQCVLRGEAEAIKAAAKQEPSFI